MPNFSEDPELAKRSSYTTKPGYSFILLPDRTINIISANIELIWTMKNYSKVFTPRQILQNAKSIFENQDLQVNNELWMNHLASSLRELCDSNLERDAKKFLKLLPTTSGPEHEAQAWTLFRSYRDFLNDIAHLKPFTDRHVGELLSDGSSPLLTPDIFDKICTEFVIHLENVFTYKDKS